MQIVKLNLIPGGVLPVCFASQHDTGRVIRFMLFEGENVFTLSGAESIELRLKKPDGSELVESVTNTGADYVDVVTTADTCDTAGASVGKIAIMDGGGVLGSGNFGLFVESDAFDGGGIVTQTASGPIATFETNIETAFVSLKSDINPVQDLHGYSKPWSGGGGKNKLNYEAWKTVSAYNGTAVFENNGVTLTATTNDCYTLSNADMRVPISEGETVTLSWQETANVNGAIYIFPNGTTSGMVYAQNASVKKLSYTATSGVTFITWRFGVQSAGVTAYYKNIQIEKGSTATAYEPYSNICPISGFSALNVTRTGINLLNGDTFASNFSGCSDYSKDTTNKTVTFSHAPDSTDNLCYVVKMPFEANTQYTLILSYEAVSRNTSLRIFYTDGTSSYCDLIATTEKTPFRIVSTANKTISHIGVGYWGAGLATLYYDECGIFEGVVTLADFEPYNGQTATVNFGQTVYKGVVDVTGGNTTSKYKRIKISDMTWTASGDFFYSSLPLKKVGNATFLCECLRVVDVAGVSAMVNGDIKGHPSNTNMYIKNTDWASATDLYNAIGDYYIVYELATPIEITTTPENLTAIVGQQNNVYGDTNGDTTVEYYIEV